MFFGCARYPDCDFGVNNEPIKDHPCSECGSILVQRPKSIRCWNCGAEFDLEFALTKEGDAEAEAEARAAKAAARAARAAAKKKKSPAKKSTAKKTTAKKTAAKKTTAGTSAAKKTTARKKPTGTGSGPAAEAPGEG